MEDTNYSLEWHCKWNFFPPLPDWLIDIARQAIQLSREERGDQVIPLPNGKTPTVDELVHALRLETFVE